MSDIDEGVGMGPNLSSLVNLQVVEFQVRKTKDKLKKGQQTIRRQEQGIKQLQGALEAKQAEIKHSRMHYDRLDLDLKSREEHVAKYRVALNSAKTNKEYSAVLTQINTIKVDVSKFEDEMLALMTQIDNDQATVKEIQESIDTQTQQLTDVRKEIIQHHVEIETELEALEEQRKEASQKVPAKARLLFDRLADRYDGEVLAEVAYKNGRRTEQSCGGCFMSIPLESVNSLMTRDDILVCSNCGRLLVLDSKPQQQTTS